MLLWKLNTFLISSSGEFIRQKKKSLRAKSRLAEKPWQYFMVIISYYSGANQMSSTHYVLDVMYLALKLRKTVYEQGIHLMNNFLK